MVVQLTDVKYTPSSGDMAYEFWESDAEKQAEILLMLAEIYEENLYEWCSQMFIVGREFDKEQREKVLDMLEEMVNQIKG